MLNNLRNELRKKQRTIREYADYIGVSKSTAVSYITEKSDIPKNKMDKTRELFPECTYEFLFESDQSGGGMRGTELAGSSDEDEGTVRNNARRN